MSKYGQFCPVAKSAEILGNSWTLLIVRELLLGSSRFSTLQKGMPRISPTVLNTRLKELEQNGIVVKRPITGQRGSEYRLTPAGKELGPVIEALVVWGMRWAREDLRDALAELAPQDRPYRHHMEGPDDMPGHIKSMLTDTSLTIPVIDGKLDKGMWQGIFLLEHRDKPHTRKVRLLYQGSVDNRH